MAGFFVADINQAPLARLRERGWGRGLGAATKPRRKAPLPNPLPQAGEGIQYVCMA